MGGHETEARRLKVGFGYGFVFLQGVRQELVHLGDAGGDAQVDGSVTDLDDESADDVGVDL